MRSEASEEGASTPRSAFGLRRCLESLSRPVDAANLALFRILFGTLMAWEIWRFFDHGWIDTHFVEPELHFSYWPFEWVQPLPEPWTTVGFAVVGISGALVGLGLFYRVSAVVLAIGLSWIFLMERARYLNHMYLLVLVAMLMAIVPAHRALSLDARLGRVEPSATVPGWAFYLLRFQIAVPYVFGGIAKLNIDWLRGFPLADWLSDEGDFPLIGPLLASGPAAATAMAWMGLLLDLSVVFLVLNRKTRAPAYGAVVLFHVMNAGLFSIGVFPWAMIGATTLFFPADWPKRLLADLRAGDLPRILGLLLGAVLGAMAGSYLPSSYSPVHGLVGAFGGGVLGADLVLWWRTIRGREPALARPESKPRSRLPRALMWALAAWVAVQVFLPFRHLLIPGHVHWTEEGHLYSWHMKLRSKRGRVRFMVTDTATGEITHVEPRRDLTSRQYRKLRGSPVMIVQYARWLGERYRAEGRRVEVRAVAMASLNGRPTQPLVDPDVDLLTVSYPWFGHADWIVPLDDVQPEHEPPPERARGRPMTPPSR